MNLIRKDLSDEELKAIGAKLVTVLNFSLFNGRPNQKNVVWCFYALKERGYDPVNPDEALVKIPEFFTRRTSANQVSLLKKLFHVDWDPDLDRVLTLRYRNIEISEKEIEGLSATVAELLEQVTDLGALGVDSDTMKSAIRAHYRLEHFQDPTEFDLDRIFDCLKNLASRAGGGRDLMAAFDTLREAIHPERKITVHESLLTPGEVEWLESLLAVSLDEPDLSPYVGEIGFSESLHSPEVLKIQNATLSFNSRCQTLTPESANSVRKLIHQSAKVLLETAVAETRDASAPESETPAELEPEKP